MSGPGPLSRSQALSSRRITVAASNTGAFCGFIIFLFFSTENTLKRPKTTVIDLSHNFN
jgi:hypothetical protein